LGHSGAADAVVLSTFMGGLALGAYVFGRRSDVTLRPLVLYGVLEIGVGFFALVFPFVLELSARLYDALPPALPGPLRNGARFLLAAMALLPPTVCMGGTVPALVRQFIGGLPQLRTELARLYGVNSLGAGLGALAAGLAFLPAFGIHLTLTLAAVVNLL